MLETIIQTIKLVTVQTMVNFQKTQVASQAAAKAAAGADLADDVVAMQMMADNVQTAEDKKTKPATIWFKIAAVIAAIFLVGYFQMDVILAMEVFALYSMIMMARSFVLKKV